ncbi:MAG: U32 family peptidase [Spirochaetaceae bacterium]|jgi:putative protease|nr:U32 family peptidase [Spirochaetaceae bacterium]
MNTQKIELLAPAGNSEALDAAIACGADAVYLGLKNFNARLRSTNFAYSQFEGLLKNLHRMKRKVYVTVNTLFVERERDRIYQLLKYLAQIGTDGIIVQDFGVLKITSECFPSLKIHSSTQMNIASSRACNVLSKHTVSRVVLARELSLEEIKAIRAKTNIELEVFVHGALCVSASGLCLFSSFLGGKSANRGMCTQACRRLYSAGDESAYYFSPLDLQLLEKLPDLAAAGVNAVKIEGRMKSAEYVGNVVGAYRRVIDRIYETDNRELIDETIKEAKDNLRNDFAREKTLFHFEENNPELYLKPGTDGGTGIKLGLIKKVKEGDDGHFALIENSEITPAVGDSIRLHKTDDSERKTHKLSSLIAGSEQEKQPYSSYWIDIPDGFRTGDSVYLIQRKSLSQRYPSIVPRDLSPYKRQPGRDNAPFLALQTEKKARFPEGLYVCVEHIEDFYVVQSIKPAFVILSLNSKNAARLINNKNPLPFKSEQTILNLDPFFNEDKDFDMTGNIEKLIERGYKAYIVNNLAHISLLSAKQKGLSLIAGAYLYSFNRYAAEFIFDLGLSSIITPFENSRQNLEQTFDKKERNAVFITVFSFPPLFRIQADLKDMYHFDALKDSKEAEFRLISGDGASRVLSESPFSLSDKIPFLRASGFKRFIIDFSPYPLQKKSYKNIMNIVKNSLVFQGAQRFNWKDGFYLNDES